MTAAELRALVVDYRRFHSMGGPLHIVLDDQNIQTQHIQWCLDNAEGWYRGWYRSEHQDELASVDELLAMTRTLGTALLDASKTQRLKACS